MLATEKLAIDGGEKTRSAPWVSWPIWDGREESELLEVLRSGQWWSVGGTKVPEFQEAFARLQEAGHCVAVTNGTAAIEIALRALEIGCGDEVIVPPYTFIATASSVLAVNATPVFVDIEPHSLNIDPARIEEAITPRTKAIIPVHIAGGPANMDGVMAVARRHGLRVIEDAAQAVGACWNGRKVGAIGDCGTFSFQASKNLNCGEGGAIVANDDEIADKLWSVHNVGRTKTGRWYEHHVLGGNFRMTEFQAAILLAQMSRLDDQICRRTENAAYLDRLLADIPGIITLPPAPGITTHAYHIYMFRFDSDGFGGRTREQFLDAARAEGIPCGAGYVPLYNEVVFQRKTGGQGSWCSASRQIDYAGYADRCPVTEKASQDTVWIMQQMLLGTKEDMDDIAGAIRKIRSAWV